VLIDRSTARAVALRLRAPLGAATGNKAMERAPCTGAGRRAARRRGATKEAVAAAQRSEARRVWW